LISSNQDLAQLHRYHQKVQALYTRETNKNLIQPETQNKAPEGPEENSKGAFNKNSNPKIK